MHQLLGQRGPGLESRISHNDPGALQDDCVIMKKSQGREGNLFQGGIDVKEDSVMFV